MTKLSVSVIHALDAGLKLNREMGVEIYKPGELLEVHCVVGGFSTGLHLWVQHDAPAGKFRFGFGDEPILETEWLTDDQAQAFVLRYFAGVSDVRL